MKDGTWSRWSTGVAVEWWLASTPPSPAPRDALFFQSRADENAPSRLWAGIHFRSANEVGVQLGRAVGHAMIEQATTDGAAVVPPSDSTATPSTWALHVVVEAGRFIINRGDPIAAQRVPHVYPAGVATGVPAAESWAMTSVVNP